MGHFWQWLAQAHEELKTEVAELGKKLAAKENSLWVTAPAFTPSFISTGSECPSGDRDSSRSHQRPPPYDGPHEVPTALNSRY